MRGVFQNQAALFSYVSPASRVSPAHPLRKICGLVRDVLVELNRNFARLHPKDGRPSVPPEQLLSALLRSARNLAKVASHRGQYCHYGCCYPCAHSPRRLGSTDKPSHPRGNTNCGRAWGARQL